MGDHTPRTFLNPGDEGDPLCVGLSDPEAILYQNGPKVDIVSHILLSELSTYLSIDL